jgi:hypothetical protein
LVKAASQSFFRLLDHQFSLCNVTHSRHDASVYPKTEVA